MLCPFADQRLIPESHTQGRIRPRMFIVHSTGGPTPRGLEGWWNNPASKGLESHFLIKNDGTLEQYVDTETRADANGQANGYAISCETESTVTATERWTPAQASMLVRLIDWCCTTHGIPRTLTPTAQGSGLAWHVQFGAPGPWTPSRGKVCPGPARVAQYQSEIIPAVQRGVTPTPKEMFTVSQYEDLKELGYANARKSDRILNELVVQRAQHDQAFRLDMVALDEARKAAKIDQQTFEAVLIALDEQRKAQAAG